MFCKCPGIREAERKKGRKERKEGGKERGRNEGRHLNYTHIKLTYTFQYYYNYFVTLILPDCQVGEAAIYLTHPFLLPTLSFLFNHTCTCHAKSQSLLSKMGPTFTYFTSMWILECHLFRGCLPSKPQLSLKNKWLYLLLKQCQASRWCFGCASECALQWVAYFTWPSALYLQVNNSSSLENGGTISSKKINVQPLLRNIFLFFKWRWFGFAVISVGDGGNPRHFNSHLFLPAHS